MDLPIPVPRDGLRVASAEAAAATKKALDASRVVNRSLVLVGDARTAITACECIDVTTAAFDAGSITLQVADNVELSAKLMRAAAEEGLIIAEAVHALLSADAMNAADEARQAEAKKIAMIADIMKATAVGMLPQLRDAEALAGRLRASIVGYMNCWALNTEEAFKPVPVEVSLLLKEPQAAPLMALAALNWQQAAVRWQEYRTELASDPDAKPPAALGWADDADMMVAAKLPSGDLVKRL